MADDELSSKCLGRIEAAIVDLASTQLHVTTKLDELIHRIMVVEARQHHSPTPLSSSFAKTFITHTLLPPLLRTSSLKPTLSPTTTYYMSF